ncbi:unnamed protein product [Vitrella brassicaformis CCMP3155]|uniref:Uncharacterized protein n=1 Tax=Vitrella brassicaformis (strain CCMP3155) TaxID=1169540 RepID=A0A0G4EVZ0_VITBC|nr:unnamed protein product [Vitrella brassicaformis CCMP3155]|eukprot:CEM02377.1 unnamed protein product [Vitrella brassicaformis CCMP3155]
MLHLADNGVQLPPHEPYEYFPLRLSVSNGTLFCHSTRRCRRRTKDPERIVSEEARRMAEMLADAVGYAASTNVSLGDTAFTIHTGDCPCFWRAKVPLGGDSLGRVGRSGSEDMTMSRGD